MPKISVIIPVYNGERYLAQTIESVHAQTMTDWELVLVDDGSTDETPAIVRRLVARDSRIRVARQENSGVAAARNRGYSEIDQTSEYVIFLDADDVWLEDALQTLFSALQDNVQTVAAHGLRYHMDADGQRCVPDMVEHSRRRRAIVHGRPAAWPVGAPTTFAVLALRNVIATPGQILIRRRAFDTLEPFDGAMSPAEDWDMWLRLTAKDSLLNKGTDHRGWRA